MEIILTQGQHSQGSVFCQPAETTGGSVWWNLGLLSLTEFDRYKKELENMAGD